MNRRLRDFRFYHRLHLYREGRINQIKIQSVFSSNKYNFSGELTLKKIGFNLLLCGG